MIYLFDALIIVTMAAAIYLGISRSWKVSFSSLAAHLLAMASAWGLTAVLTPVLVLVLSPYLNVSELLPAQIGFWAAPFQESILHTLLFSVLFILFFVTAKSILHAFSWTYDWGMTAFRRVRFPRVVDGFFSALFTAIHGGTWLWAVILTVAFPFFNLDKSYSLTGLLLQTPILRQQVTALYGTYEHIQVAMDIVDRDVFQVWGGDSINQEALAAMAPEEIRELKYSLVEALPYLPPELTEPIHQIIVGINAD